MGPLMVMGQSGKPIVIKPIISRLDEQWAL